MRPGQEAELGLVHVADPGEVALVQQGLGDRTCRGGAQPAQRLLLVPVGAEQVGTQVADRRVLLVPAEKLDDTEREAHCEPVVGAQHHTRLVGGPPPAGAGVVEVPGPLHLQVGVQRDRVADPGEQVLAARARAGHRPTGQIGGGQRRDPEVGRLEHPAGECLVEVSCGAPDGVALRHGSAAPSAWRRSRPPRGPGAARSSAHPGPRCAPRRRARRSADRALLAGPPSPAPRSPGAAAPPRG